MDAQNINNILSKIKILKLLEYQNNKAIEKDGKWTAACPFHSDGDPETMLVYPDENKVHCIWCCEDKKWTLVEYVSLLYKFNNGQVYEYLQKYWNDTRPKKAYEIAEHTRHKIVIRIEDREYMLTGVKLKKLHDFSMTIKADYSDMMPFFSDVNLSNTRSRKEFINNAKEHFLLSEEILEHDTDVLMNAVADMQEETLDQLETETSMNKKKFIPTEAETEEAMRVLGVRDIVFNELLGDMESLEFKGEEAVKIVLFLACVSRVLSHPISVLIISGSGKGKSHAIEMITSCFPDEVVHDLTGMSPQSLVNYGPNDLRNHILVTDEIKGMDEGLMYYIRSLQSKGKLNRAISVQDKTTSLYHTIEKNLNGPVAYFTSTTNEDDVNDENMNRMMILSVDDSTEQNLRIMASMVKKRTKKGILLGHKMEKIFRKYKAIACCMKTVYPVIPDEWVEHLTRNAESLFHKRQFDGYLTMIEALALTRQYQRKHFFLKDESGKLYDCVYITARDIQDVNKLMVSLYDLQYEELKGSNAKCLEHIRAFCQKEVKGTEMKYYEKVFTMLDIHNYTNDPDNNTSKMPVSTIKKAFIKLFEDQYIVRTYGKHKTRSYFKLNIENDNEEFSGRKLKLWNPK